MMKLFSVPALFAGALAMDTKTGRVGTIGIDEEVVIHQKLGPIEIDTTLDQCMSSKVVTAESEIVFLDAEGNDDKRMNIGHGAFAAVDIAAGEVIEAGTSNQINCNGQRWQMVFTWENPEWGAAPEDRKKWGICSGHAAFYNTSKDPNTKMYRAFYTLQDGSTQSWYEIRAIKDIKAGDALTHTYVSLAWRQEFKGINKDSTAANTVRFPNLLKEIRKEATFGPDFVNSINAEKVHVQGNKAYAAVALDAEAQIEMGLFRFRPHHMMENVKFGEMDSDRSLHRIPHPDDALNWVLGEEQWALASGKMMQYNFVPLGDERANARIVYSYDAAATPEGSKDFLHNNVSGTFKVFAIRQIEQGEPLFLERLGHGPISAEVGARFVEKFTVTDARGEVEVTVEADRRIEMPFAESESWAKDQAEGYAKFLAAVNGEEYVEEAKPLRNEEAKPARNLNMESLMAGHYNRELQLAAGGLAAILAIFYASR